MKCPQCSTTQKFKEGLVCKKCQYKHCFSPKDASTGKITDTKFLAAIKKASRNQTVSFTANQLYSGYLASQKSSKNYLTGVVPLVVFGFIAMMMFGWEIAIVVVFVVLGIMFFKSRQSVMSRSDFRACISKWQKNGNTIQGLIEKPSLHQPPAAGWTETDIYDYGVERILIVNRDLLVDLLVKNNQHSEQRMVVIAESGYPDYMKAHVARLLKERSDLPVFLLHDADDQGVGMKQRVQQLPWLPLAQHPVVDLGFFPTDFQKLKRTQNFESSDSERHLPVDALLMTSLVLGMGTCFAARTTFADELLRERTNEMSAGSSFG